MQVQGIQEWAPALEILKIKVVNLRVGREGTMATQWFASSPIKSFPPELTFTLGLPIAHFNTYHTRDGFKLLYRHVCKLCGINFHTVAHNFHAKGKGSR